MGPVVEVIQYGFPCPVLLTPASYEQIIIIPSFLLSVGAVHMELFLTYCHWVLTAAQVIWVLPLSSLTVGKPRRR